MKRGWTLTELLISLVVTGAILSLAAQHALAQLRFFDSAASLAAMRGQISHATGILARALEGVSPLAGDLVVAADSAVEFLAYTGSAVVCSATNGQLVIPATRDRGNTLAAFWETPEEGDGAHIYFDDSTGSGWLTLHVAAPPTPGPACATLDEVAPGWLVPLQEPVVVPAGAVVRFSRAVRFSLYRGGDSRWYLGSRDWNGAAARFNAIQPVAGPLRPHSMIEERSGLRLRYLDAAGGEVWPPADLGTVAAVEVSSRAETDRALRIAGQMTFGDVGIDSSTALVRLRNVP